MRLKLQKIELRPNIFFYIGFFVLCAAAEYFFLYHATGLQAFQINAHFFSNVTGSFSKRFISDAAPLALLLFLAHYCKKQWMRYILIGLFVLIFIINAFTVGYYFVNQSNWKFVEMKFTPILIIFTVFAVILALGMGYYALKFKSDGNVWPFKKNLFTVLLILLTLLTPLIPIGYSAHRSLVTTQENVEKFFRVVYLETPGITHLYQILTGTSKPMEIPDVSAFDLKKQVNSLEK
jgi:membrane protein YdbS with pleckstrin-like domain